MSRVILAPDVREAVQVYLDGLAGDEHQLLEGSRVFETPSGSLNSAARVQVAGEVRRLLVLAPGSEPLQLARILAWLEKTDLREDLLVFLDPSGLPAATPLKALAGSGLRRRFHLGLTLAELQGRLEDPQEVQAVLEQALEHPPRSSSETLQILDELRPVLARPYWDLPTLLPAARALGLFLGVCGIGFMGGEHKVHGGRLPVFDFTLGGEVLRLEAGRAALQALVHPEHAGLLEDVLRGMTCLVRDRELHPPGLSGCWVRWMPQDQPLSEQAQGILARLRQQRVEAIRAGGAAESSALTTAWVCPGCGGEQLTIRDLAELHLRHMQELLDHLRREVNGSGARRACRCGLSLTSQQLQALVLHRGLPGHGVELHLELLRRADGRLIDAWGLLGPTGEWTSLPGDPSAEALEEVLGRPLSLAASWVGAMEAVEESGRAEGRASGGLSRVLVIPPGPARATEERLAALLDGLEWDTVARIHLAGGPRLHPPPGPPDFRQWAARFTSRIEAGAYGTAALVDWRGFQGRVLEVVERAGMSARMETRRPGRIEVRADRAWATVDLRRLLVCGILQGSLPEDVAARVPPMLEAGLRRTYEVVEALRALMPPGEEVAVEPARQRALLGSQRVEVDVEELAARWSESPEFLACHVRYLLGTEEGASLERCRCGQGAHLTLRLRPASWAASLPQGARPVRAAGRGLPGYYARQCPFHADFLERDDLARMGHSLRSLEEVRGRHLDRAGGRFQGLRLEGEGVALALVGSEVASLASDPRLVSGALEAAGCPRPPRIELEAPSANLLLLYESFIARESVEALQAAALDTLEGGEGPGEALGHHDSVRLGAARGRILIDLL